MSSFISNAFASLWSHITGLGSEALHYIQSNIVPIVQHDAQQAIPKLAPIAEAAVLQLATTGHVSNDKRDMAVAQVKQAAIGAGLDVGTSVLNLVVETAYNKLRTTGQLASAASEASAGTSPVAGGVSTAPASTN